MIAAAAGGALETVQEGVTGQLVPPDDGTALKRTLRSFDPDEFDPSMIREHAENFSAQSFRARFDQEVREAVQDGPAEPPAPSAPPLFAASAGGHLDLLRAIAPDVVDGPEPVWVTSHTPRGERLREDAEEVELLPEYGRSPRGALRNVLSAAWVVARRRPRTVVTSGAGVVAPFCVLARLAGARLLYVETMARVSRPSMTARVLSRIADRVVVQWPELASALPRAEVCRPTLLENVADGEHPAGAGTFVAVGTHAQPYTRLLETVGRAIEEGLLPGPVRAQVGPAVWERSGGGGADHRGGRRGGAAPARGPRRDARASVGRGRAPRRSDRLTLQKSSFPVGTLRG